MEPFKQVLAALDKHVSVDDNPRGFYVAVHVDEDVRIPIQPYSAEQAEMDAILGDGFAMIRNDDDMGVDEDGNVFEAGVYYLIDPSETWENKAVGTLRANKALILFRYTESRTDEDGHVIARLDSKRLVTHRDVCTHHVATKQLSLFDVLCYLAANDATRANRAEDAAAILEFVSPANYDTHLTHEQQAEIVSHMGDGKAAIVRSNRTITNVMGAYTHRRKIRGPFQGNDVDAITIGVYDDMMLYRVVDNQIFNLDSETMKLFCLMVELYTSGGGHFDPFGRPTVVTSMDHVCERLGKKNDKNTRTAIRRMYGNLCGLGYSEVDSDGEYNKGNTWVTETDVTDLRNLKLVFEPKFAACYMGSNAPMLALDPCVYMTNSSKNPAAFPIAYRLIDNATQNTGSQQYRIGVSRLLDFCKCIPSDESVAAKRQGKSRRIKPLQRDLDHLVEIGFLKEWHYCRTGGEPLHNGDLDGKGLLDYSLVKTAYGTGRDVVLVTWTPTRPFYGHQLDREDAKAKSKALKDAENAKREARKAERRHNVENIIDRKVAENIAEKVIESRTEMAHEYT